MKSIAIKKKDANLLLLKKDSNSNTSIKDFNQISLNFHLNPFHKKNNSKNGRLYSNYNYISKISNYQNKNIDHSYINTCIKNSSPNTNLKSTNIDISTSNNDLTNKITIKDNLTKREYQKDLKYAKHYHHKKINSHIFLNNNQIMNELFPTSVNSNSNNAKDSIIKYEKKNESKILKKKNIQIDTRNINNNNNNTNINNNEKKITNNNNPHKINLKIYLEKHQRILSTDSNNIIINNKNKNRGVGVVSKNKNKNKKYQKYIKKDQINSVIKNKRLITNQNSTRLLNHLNYTSNTTLSRANSSWINKEYNICNTSLEKSISKNNKYKANGKVKINNVIVKNMNNFIKQKKLKLASNNNELKKNDLLNMNKLKEKTTLYYLTNISEELKSKKKNYTNGNNIFININNYTNDNKKKINKSNVNLIEGKNIINIQNYIGKKSTSQKGISKIRRRNYLKKNENNYKLLGGSKNSSQNKTYDYFNSNNSDNDKNDKNDGPEETHFFLVSSIQKGIKNIKNYK